MKFKFGEGYVLQEEADDGAGGDGGGGGGSGAPTPQGGEQLGAEHVAKHVDDAAGAGGGKEGQPKDMLEAITQGLEKTAPKAEDDATKKVADDATAAQEKHPNGQPKKNDKGEDLDESGKLVPKQAPKAKTAAELDLKPEDKKILGAKAQGRFAEVITTLKARETEIATLTEQMKPLSEARDTMIGILEETKTTSDQLSAYLEFNRMLQTGDPKDLEAALGMIENQRAALYKALGREGDGVDLLAEFADLQADVGEAKITRERALELAQARRVAAANEQRNMQARTAQQGQEQRKQASDKALNDIEAWTVELSSKDIDYKAKEEKLLEQVDQVIKNYPPSQWVATLKLLYQGIVTQKAPMSAGRGNQPLRPSGAKPGAKAPQNMFEAMWGTEKA